MTMRFKRALLLAKIETTFDTDANPTATSDAFLVMEPSFVPDITFLERANVRTSLSKEAPIAGRKLGKISFKHEARNNGVSGASTPPMLGVLLRGCGMKVTARNNAALCLRTITDTTANSGGDTFAVSTAFTQPVFRRIYIDVMTSGAAPKLRVTAPAEGDLPAIDTGTADITAANTVEFDVYDIAGNLVVGLTPTMSGAAMTAGDHFEIELQPTGNYYTPRSSSFESLTMYLYFPDDNGNAILHKLTGARGTWSLEAKGGDLAVFSFEFTGSYVDPSDVVYPTNPVYESQKPSQVELAGLRLIQDGTEVTSLCASKFTLDLANDVQPRDCLNSPDGFAGALIVDRTPVMGMDPESVLEGTHPFWANMAAAVGVEWSARVGTARGNTVLFYAPNVVTNGLGYQDRNSIRAYDFKAALAAGSGVGDDEIIVGFV